MPVPPRYYKATGPARDTFTGSEEAALDWSRQHLRRWMEDGDRLYRSHHSGETVLQIWGDDSGPGPVCVVRPLPAPPCDCCREPLDTPGGWEVHPPGCVEVWCSACACVDPETGESLAEPVARVRAALRVARSAGVLANASRADLRRHAAEALPDLEAEALERALREVLDG